MRDCGIRSCELEAEERFVVVLAAAFKTANAESERLRLGIEAVLARTDSRSELRAALRRLLEGVNP